MLRPISMSLFLAAAPALAAETSPATAEMGSRTFLVGQIPWEHAAKENFFPINGVDWIYAIMKADPVLGPRHTVFYLRDEADSLSERLASGWTDRHFGSRDLVPGDFLVEGLRVEVNPDHPQPFRSYLYMEEGDDPGWTTTCSFNAPHDGTDNEFLGCLMTVTYPADLDLNVGLRIYGPPPRAEIGTVFPALAARMVEILTCLDVTHDIPATPAEGHARLAVLRAENPELRNCELKLSSSGPSTYPRDIRMTGG